MRVSARVTVEMDRDEVAEQVGIRPEFIDAWKNGICVLSSEYEEAASEGESTAVDYLPDEDE